MTDVLKTLAKLPEMCAIRNAATGDPIMIKRGELGYYPITSPNFDVDGFNQRRGITRAQVRAMEIGSMFGWDVPGVEHELLSTEQE